uniref:Uncharacterized protein n=1 Tax=Ignisphaera aggregans TaxID=334771 RepID=A0A7J3JQ25_9CREN
MQETIYGYTIYYVEEGQPIDKDNYNNLLYATIELHQRFIYIYKFHMDYHNISWLYSYYQAYLNFINRLNLIALTAESFKGVFPYHYLNIRDALMAIASGIHNLHIGLEEVGLPIPWDWKVTLDNASDILYRYPRPRKGDIVSPIYHNDLLKALKILKTLVDVLYPEMTGYRVLNPLRTYVWNTMEGTEYWRYAFTEYFKIYDRGDNWWVVGFEDYMDMDYNEPILFVESLTSVHARITIILVEAMFRSALYYGTRLLADDVRNYVGRSWIVTIP